MKLLGQPCALVDLETTGASPTSDAITEIGLLLSDAEGNLTTWEQLVNPGKSIPEFISQLTGISNEMVAEQPYFDELATALHEKLQGAIFVAHNARFDYGFLKAAFKACGLNFKPKIICTVKLARRLFPEWQRYSLEAICREIGYPQETKHRAMADVNAMFAFLCYAKARHGEETVDQACQAQLRKPALPVHIAADVIDSLPDTPGVYHFYGTEGLLYVGKSINIRSRVMSHFSADHQSQKEMTLSRSVQRIEVQQTAGELGALLLENQQIKTLSPIYNRKQRRYKCLWMWRPVTDAQGFTSLALDNLSTENWQIEGDLFGPFRSRYSATQALKKIIKEKQLCQKILGLESGSGPCFARQLQQCRGACEGEESALKHNLRLMESLCQLKLKAWPYAGAIGIREVCSETDKTDIHIVDQWAYLGTVHDAAQLQEITERPVSMFDIETYRIIYKAIYQAGKNVIPLSTPIPSDIF